MTFSVQVFWSADNEAGAFLPNSNIKRSEVAAILIRMFDATARQTIVPSSPSSHA